MSFINRYIGSIELWPIKTALVAVLLTLLMSFPFPVFAQSAVCDSIPAEKPIGNLDINLVDCIFKNGFEACLAEIIGYRDSDHDGFGELAGEPSAFCDSLPFGFADNALDCDDGNDARFPGNIESCDSLDNDCNGVIDEPFVNLGMPCSTGTGMCNNTGTYVCSADGSAAMCNAVAGSEQPEICDGLDNNCDGQIDEPFFNLGMACSVGIGMCNRIGTYVCSADGSAAMCNVVAGSEQPEICDGLDNDCDGEIDEGCPG